MFELLGISPQALFSQLLLGLINGSDVAEVHFIDSEKYRVFATASPAGASRP